jgi:hypothetical protein
MYVSAFCFIFGFDPGSIPGILEIFLPDLKSFFGPPVCGIYFLFADVFFASHRRAPEL